MNNVELADRLAAIWKDSRAASGKSQDYIAKALGVSKKTVQNWEAGIGSPSLKNAILWFDYLDVPIYPYLMSVIHVTDTGRIKEEDNESTVKGLISTYVDELSEHTARELLYLLYGSHGSSPLGVIEMITAYLHTPLSMRLNIASSILTNYEICKANGLLENTKHVAPDNDFVTKCYRAGKEAVLSRKTSYSMLD